MAQPIASLEPIAEPIARSGFDSAASSWDAVQLVLDCALAAGTALLWAPVLLALLALKWLIDGRPVLFHQVRIGRNGKPFLLHKIKTTPTAYQPRPEDWPDADFPPRTRFGQWLRRLDLDELPQLWNVLRGEMSLVGPRPETPYHSQKLASTLPQYPQRLLVRPGLTGLAQVRGWRGNTSIYQRLIADLEYVARRGPRVYFSTLAGTVWIEARRAFQP